MGAPFTPCQEQPAGGENNHQEHNNSSPRGRVGADGSTQAENQNRGGNYGGRDYSAAERAGEREGDEGGDCQHRRNQEDPDGADGNCYGQGNQGGVGGLCQDGVPEGEGGEFLVEAEHKDVRGEEAVIEDDGTEEDGGDDDIRGADCQDAAEQVGVQVCRESVGAGDNQYPAPDPEGEEEGDGRVAVDPVVEHAGNHVAPQEGYDDDGIEGRDAEEYPDGGAGESGVSEAVAQEGQAAQHQRGPDGTAA